MHKTFTVHMLNDIGKERAQFIARRFDELLSDLEKICPPGRELALVNTKLEEACFYAKKAMCSDPSNGVEAPGTAQSVPTPPEAPPAAPDAFSQNPDPPNSTPDLPPPAAPVTAPATFCAKHGVDHGNGKVHT